MSNEEVPPSKIERAIIRFLRKENVTSADIYRRLYAAYGTQHAIAARTVRR